MGQPEEKTWEWPVLGDTVICLCINAVAKSFLQETGAACYISIPSPARVDFVLAKLAVQCHAHGGDEFAEPGCVYIVAGQPIGERAPVRFHLLPGWDQPQPCVHFPGGHCSQSTAAGGIDGHHGFPADHTPVIIADEDLNRRIFQRGAGRLVADGIFIGGFDILVIALAVILFPFLMERLGSYEL
jgi:hypothetical protein